MYECDIHYRHYLPGHYKHQLLQLARHALSLYIEQVDVGLKFPQNLQAAAPLCPQLFYPDHPTEKYMHRYMTLHRKIHCYKNNIYSTFTIRASVREHKQIFIITGAGGSYAPDYNNSHCELQ